MQKETAFPWSLVFKARSMLNDLAHAPTPDLVRRLRAYIVACQAKVIPLLRRSFEARLHGRSTGSSTAQPQHPPLLAALHTQSRTSCRRLVRVLAWRKPPIHARAAAPTTIHPAPPQPQHHHNSIAQPQHPSPSTALHTRGQASCGRLIRMLTWRRPTIGALAAAPTTAHPTPPQPQHHHSSVASAPPALAHPMLHRAFGRTTRAHTPVSPDRTSAAAVLRDHRPPSHCHPPHVAQHRYAPVLDTGARPCMYAHDFAAMAIMSL